MWHVAIDRGSRGPGLRAQGEEEVEEIPTAESLRDALASVEASPPLGQPSSWTARWLTDVLGLQELAQDAEARALLLQQQLLHELLTVPACPRP